MNWALAIDRNRAALLVVVAAIAALIGGRVGSDPISRRLRSAALALLRPAESAARRLIVIAAHGLAVTLAPRRPPVIDGGAAGRAAGNRPPAFSLFDRRKRFGRMIRMAELRGVPRIRTFWGAPPATPTSPAAAARLNPDAPVEVARLRLRLRSLETALADLPRQARRLARVRARRASDTRPCQPLRLGQPPGHRCTPGREIDFVLRECHALALDALTSDTS